MRLATSVDDLTFEILETSAVFLIAYSSLTIMLSLSLNTSNNREGV